jgi:hypothetical protein
MSHRLWASLLRGPDQLSASFWRAEPEAHIPEVDRKYHESHTYVKGSLQFLAWLRSTDP